MIRSPQIRMVNILLVVLILSTGLTVFVILPVFREIAELQEEIQEARQREQLLVQEVQRYQKAAADLEQIQARQSEIENLFPKRQETVVLVEGLEQAIGQAGLISDLRITDQEEERAQNPGKQQPEVIPSQVAGLSQVQEIPYVLEVTGDYRQLVDYFLYFDQLPFISEVSKLTIKADQEQNEVTGEVSNTGTATTKIEGVFFIELTI